MRYVDAWRLMGRNVQTAGPAALIEVSFEAGEDRAAALSVLTGELARIGRRLSMTIADVRVREFSRGAYVTFPAPIDRLLAAADLAEWAGQSAEQLLSTGSALDLEPRASEMEAAARTKASPALVALEAEARRRGVPFLWDDELVTVGLGARSRTFPIASPPALADVPWDSVGAIPVGLVTGTNGKTTSTRLAARMAREAGHVVATTTTDGVTVGDDWLERGDYTGPGGARLALRDPRVTAAVLETARGGILRRGLAVDGVDGALLTNVAADHLGHYGVDDVATLAQVKAVIGQAVRPGGRVVLNADDAVLASLAAAPAAFVAGVSFFSLDARTGAAWYAKDGALFHGARLLARVDEVPIAFGGAAPYNVANCLGAAALASAMGVSDDAIARALRAFDDNPGRGNLFDAGGVKVILDFGHNPEGVRAVLALARRMNPARLAVIAGYAGDRGDDSAREAARAIAGASPSRVWLRELAGYERGRAPGEMPELLRLTLEGAGVDPGAIELAASEASALRGALDWARPGDLVLVLAHLEREPVRAVLGERGALPVVHRG